MEQAVRKPFYDSIRRSLFKKIGHKQFAGLEYILDEWGETGYDDIRWLAYALATTFHETARTMQPIKERGGYSYFMRMYDRTGNRPHVAKRLGNTQTGDGAKFAGRGYVQLTGRTNYNRASKALGINFIADPDRVMEPDLAAHIMFVGMEVGWFTTRGFAHYINDKKCDYWNARRIINGTDKAGTIAGYARKFEAALREIPVTGDAPVPAPVQPPAPKPAPEPVDIKPKTLLELIISIIKGIFGK